MKLRIFNNSIRLRLRQSEVADLVKRGVVEARLDFGAGVALTYRLVADADAVRPEAAFHNGEIRITVPGRMAREWAEGDDVAIAASQDGLSILVEKDFQCLHKDDTSQADAYPNPMMS